MIIAAPGHGLEECGDWTRAVVFFNMERRDLCVYADDVAGKLIRVANGTFDIFGDIVYETIYGRVTIIFVRA